MKSIGELKKMRLPRCDFTDIFIQYSEMTDLMREDLESYLKQFAKPSEECIMCGHDLRGFDGSFDADREICAECGYPTIAEHTVSEDFIMYFSSVPLQLHPSELRG